MFSGSNNRVKALIKILCHSFIKSSEKIKMADGEIHFLKTIVLSILKTKLYLLTLYTNNTTV